MAQPPHYNPQQNVLPQQQNVSRQQLLGQKPVSQVAGASAMGLQQNFTTTQQVGQPEKTIIDEFEATFQSCLAPLLPGTGSNQGGMTVSPEKLRSSVEHSIQQFTEQARKVEAYFVKKHAMVAQQQPELILQEEIEELKEEITRRDTAIRNHANKIKSWQENLKNLQNNLNERIPAAPPPNTGAALPQPVGHVHPELMQHMAAQRR